MPSADETGSDLTLTSGFFWVSSPSLSCLVLFLELEPEKSRVVFAGNLQEEISRRQQSPGKGDGETSGRGGAQHHCCGSDSDTRKNLKAYCSPSIVRAIGQQEPTAQSTLLARRCSQGLHAHKMLQAKRGPLQRSVNNIHPTVLLASPCTSLCYCYLGVCTTK